MNRRSLASAVVGLVAVALTAAGCGSDDSSGDSEGQPLTIGMPNGPQTENHNPFMNTSSAMSLGYAFAMYEPLVQVNLARPSEDPTPWLASEFTWNDDYTAVTFTARDGAKWSDGEDFTAEDIAYSFNIRKDNEALNTEGLPYDDVTVDGSQVTVSFTDSQRINEHKVLQIFMVPEHIWTEIDDPTTDLNEDPIGTGPYTLKTWTPQAATLVPNEDYWGGDPAVPELRYSTYNDNSALTTALATGDAQWGWTFIADYEDVYISKDPDNHKAWFPTGLGIDVLYVNTETKPFNNAAMRKAVSMVVDREAVHAQAHAGVFPKLESPTGLPLPAGESFMSAEYQGVTMEPDVEGAKQVLADAGYTLQGDKLIDPDGEPVTFELVDPAGWADYLADLQIVADGVKDLGIEATVSTMNADAWFTAIANGEFQASMHWTDTGVTPFNIYSNIMDGAHYKPLGDKADWNFGRYQNDAATKALQDYANATDEATAQTALDVLQDIMVNEVPGIPMVARPIGAEFSEKHYTGFPSEDNPYATPQPTMVNASMILMNLKPVA